MSSTSSVCKLFNHLYFELENSLKAHTDLNSFLQLLDFQERVTLLIKSKRSEKNTFSFLPSTLLLYLLSFTSTCNFFCVCVRWNVALKGISDFSGLTLRYIKDLEFDEKNADTVVVANSNSYSNTILYFFKKKELIFKNRSPEYISRKIILSHSLT